MLASRATPPKLGWMCDMEWRAGMQQGIPTGYSKGGSLYELNSVTALRGHMHEVSDVLARLGLEAMALARL
jgi:hypothetical protein